MRTKICSKCNNERNLDDFYPKKRCKFGVNSYCKYCSVNINRERYDKYKNAWAKWREKNPEKVREYRKNALSKIPKKKRLENYKNYNNLVQKKDFGLYKKYFGMKGRCEYKSHSRYSYYGGRGIKCLWKNYNDFKSDMYKSYIGHLKEHGHKQTTIDRIDVNGNYCKENCRWSTMSQQLRNRRISKKMVSLYE